ncbi:unnamed protein product, partial [Rotaria sp. Silwood1]
KFTSIHFLSLKPKPAPRTIPPTYQHLTQQVQRKPALYGAGQ